ncbi:hypothetical protein D9758_015923 [Tetrapyrgos nigripes]|uniref:Uncharacterized protein n=1 Tax=Tetrapyrgos nigripes TaxID=182062 RepID=A0A8H5FMM0_9AGAR|nr:hypothetical protein D9758_015923 [Tetrapyrgos nigripes]
MSNEFHTFNKTWSNLVPSGPGYSDNPTCSGELDLCDAWEGAWAKYEPRYRLRLRSLLSTGPTPFHQSQHLDCDVRSEFFWFLPSSYQQQNRQRIWWIGERLLAVGGNTAGTTATKDNTKPPNTTGPKIQTQPRKIFTWHHLTYEDT